MRRSPVGTAEPPGMSQHVLSANLVVEQVEAERGFRLRLAIKLPLKSPDAFWCCQTHRQSPILDLFKSTPEARLLPSTAITRLQRYYDPLRLPPGAHRRGYGAQAPPQWVSHVTRITFATCHAHYPGGPDGGCRHLLPSVLPSPILGRVGIRNCTFEACSGFTRVMAHRIAQPP